MRTVRTVKRRRQFLEELARTGNVEKACALVGMGKSAAYCWKREDEAFSNEWNTAVERVIDAVEAKLIEQAMTDDTPAGVTSPRFWW